MYRSAPLLALAVFVAALLAGESQAQPAKLEAFFTRFTNEWVKLDPNLAVSTGYFKEAEQDALEQQLTPQTLAFKQQVAALARAGLSELAAINLNEVSEGQRIASDVMRWQLQRMVDWEPYLNYSGSYFYSMYPLQQMDGANVELVSALTVVHPLDSKQHAEHYLTRLQQMDERMAEALTESQRQAGLGILPPAFILDATLQQMEDFVANAPDQNPIVTTLFDKTAAASDLDEAQRKAMAAQAATIVEQQLYPVWRRAIAELQSQRAQATDEAGISRFADGDKLYASLLRYYTSTDLTADEIHDIGLQEVARIEAEMDTLFRQIGMTQGTLNERVEQLTRKLSFPATEQGRADYMAEVQRILADAKVRSDSLFDMRPKSDVIAQPYPEFRWATAAATYMPPTLDGARPGIFQAPLRPDSLNTFGLRSLVYHETVPGHHFQVGLFTENPALPKFMQTSALGYISANVEGWALYAERLAAESHWYDGDIEGHIGQLNYALFRARRLVVDTGLHAKHWTRQQAIDYGISPSEVDRYVVWPGQACSYMLGQLKIVELRERARGALEDKFSLSEFHNVVLGVGQVPLPVLENAVDVYIVTKALGVQLLQ